MTEQCDSVMKGIKNETGETASSYCDFSVDRLWNAVADCFIIFQSVRVFFIFAVRIEYFSSDELYLW